MKEFLAGLILTLLVGGMGIAIEKKEEGRKRLYAYRY